MQNKIINRYHELKSVKALSREFKMTEDAISRILANNQILDWMTLSMEEKANIIKLYTEGMSIREIHEKFNYGKKRIMYTLLSEQLMRTRTSSSKKDESVFETINTEQKAYWLGFLYADGYVATSKRANIELTLQEQDLNHLQEFKRFMKSDSKISKKVINLKGNEYIAYRIIICSKKIVEDLTKCGCTNKKSFNITFPNENILPRNLRNHFIRGFFDGDGCILRSNGQLRLSLLGPELFLNDICNIFHVECGVNERKAVLEKRRNKVWSVWIGGNIQNKKIYNYLYNNSTVYLDRKRNKFLPS